MTATAHPAMTVAVVEDDASVRRSLADVLNRAKGMHCTGEYSSAEQALREIPLRVPQIVLMDINLPGMDGVECAAKLIRLVPGIHILMLTVHEDADAIFRSLSVGARGYLLKPVRSADLLTAVKDVHTGGAPMTSSIARKVVQSFQKSGPSPNETENLSVRELEILRLLAKGYLYKEVADMLSIGYATVHTHIYHIYDKLQVRSRAQAVAKYHKL